MRSADALGASAPAAQSRTPCGCSCERKRFDGGGNVAFVRGYAAPAPRRRTSTYALSPRVRMVVSGSSDSSANQRNLMRDVVDRAVQRRSEPAANGAAAHSLGAAGEAAAAAAPSAPASPGSENERAPLPTAGPGPRRPGKLSPMPWDTTSSSSTEGIQNLSFVDQQLRFQRRRELILAKAYHECKRITSTYAKTFYLGSSFLNSAKRLPVWAVYVWCRRTDDIVDGPRASKRKEDLLAMLDAWEERLESVFAGKAHDALDFAVVDVIERYPRLSAQPFRDMIEGMRMDLSEFRYETWDDLYLYCYRVAATVGLMTLPIMGTSREGAAALEEATPPAVALGIALQLTNILRDVGEDRHRGRIYLPQEDLRRFNYTEAELFDGVVNDNYVELMKFEINRARSYFAQAEKGIALLAPDARLPVRASMDIYSQILDKLEANKFDNFTKRAYVPKMEKLRTLPLCWLRTQSTGVFGYLYNLLGRP